MFKNKNRIHPHSNRGWKFSIYSTEKFFIERYNNSFIKTYFTHNAIAENINELKLIFKEILNYEYINETLFSKERNILTLNQPHFYNLYLLNILKRKVHSIQYKYIEIENVNKAKLETKLFVINTSGNHIPLKRQYLLEKRFMEKRFYINNKYEIKYKINNSNKNYYFLILKSLIIFYIIKFIKIYKFYQDRILY